MDVGSPEWRAIFGTFGERQLDFRWSGNDVFFPAYSSIWDGAAGLANVINGHTFAAGEKLNIIAHSHGGNVVKIASYSIGHRIDNLVALGTPQNFDLPTIYSPAVNNYCEVSSFTDYVQFAGASPLQTGLFGYAQYQVGYWLYQESLDLYYNNWDEAAFDAFEVAYYQSLAASAWLSTKLDPLASTNVLYDSGAHSDLHEPPVWFDLVGACNLSR
jgi:hypothetical protein